jgi:hypothetical protein
MPRLLGAAAELVGALEVATQHHISLVAESDFAAVSAPAAAAAAAAAAASPPPRAV